MPADEVAAFVIIASLNIFCSIKVKKDGEYNLLHSPLSWCRSNPFGTGLSSQREPCRLQVIWLLGCVISQCYLPEIPDGHFSLL